MGLIATTAAVNPFLTTYAQGQMADRMNAMKVARALCPIVNVGPAAGQYKAFDDRNAFTVYDTYRGLGGSANRITFTATDGSYDCKPHALDVAVDDHEYALANAGGNPLASQLLDEGKIRALLNSTALAHAKRVIDYAAANVTAGIGGDWSKPDIDPIDQLDANLETLSTNVGSTENINLVIGVTSWRKLRNHPKVKQRISAIKTSINTQDLIDMLMFPVTVTVGVVSTTGTKRGQTAASITKTSMLGDYVYLLYSVPSPTIYDPSCLKCFSTGIGLVESVRTARDEGARSTVHLTDWSEDIKQTGSLAGLKLTIS